jgi:hypothetical protein
VLVLVLVLLPLPLRLLLLNHHTQRHTWQGSHASARSHDSDVTGPSAGSPRSSDATTPARLASLPPSPAMFPAAGFRVKGLGLRV